MTLMGGLKVIYCRGLLSFFSTEEPLSMDSSLFFLIIKFLLVFGLVPLLQILLFLWFSLFILDGFELLPYFFLDVLFMIICGTRSPIGLWDNHIQNNFNVASLLIQHHTIQ